MNAIEKALLQLAPISLSEMDSVKLMNRVDTKYVFSLKLLPDFLTAVANQYRVLEINQKKIIPYQTLYYDTAERSLYMKHHSGHLNRHKIRYRKYGESNLGFFEIKFKNNKGRTVKERIKRLAVPQELNGEVQLFIENKSPYLANTLAPVVWTNFSRMTLVSNTATERLTLDVNLEFVSGNKQSILRHVVIAEVKQGSASDSVFKRLMRIHHIREGSISKYCMAVATSFPDAKRNNFKEKLRFINKINSYDTATNN